MHGASSRLDVLGPSRLVADDGHLVPTPPRVRRLLGVLLARPGHSVSQARLEALLWDGAAPTTAHNRVQAAVSSLRRAMASAGLDQQASVVSDGRGYAMCAPEPLVDHQRFAALVHAAAEDDGPARVRNLRAALGLWRGEPFADVPSARDRLPVVRTLEALRAEAETMLAYSLEDLARPTEALSVLTGAFRRAPADECIAGHLMRMYVSAGRRSAALEVFATARAALRDRFGADPNPELAALHMELMGATPARGATPPGVGRRPGRSAVGIPVGVRSRTLLASNTGRRFICVTGDAGAGKTAIARHVMGEAAAHGAVCLLGSAHPGSSQLQPLLDASRPLPELRTIVEKAAESWAYEEAPAAATAAVERALAVESSTVLVVLVIEDIQWADDATLETLRHLARTADRGNLVVIVSFNPNEDHRRRATRTVDGIARYVSVERMNAAPLTASSTAQVIASVLPAPPPALVESLLRRGAANMGAVVELAAAVSTAPVASAPESLQAVPLPSSVRDRVERQLRGLSAEACRALALAAAFAHEHDGVRPEDVTDHGSRLPLATVEDVFAMALRRRFIVVAEGHRFRFRNRLIEEVLRTMLSPLETRPTSAKSTTVRDPNRIDTEYLHRAHEALTAATEAETEDPAAAHVLYLEALVLCTQHEIGGAALTRAADGVSRTDIADAIR